MFDGGGDSLGCFHILLHYDPRRLRLVDAKEGDLFHNSGITTLFLWEYPTSDTTAFTDCLLGYRTYVLGPGEIVKLRFRVLACSPNIVPLELVTHRANPPPPDLAFLADIDRQQIGGVQWQSGSATICNGCNAAVGDPRDGRRGALSVSPIPAVDRIRIGWDLPIGQQEARIEVFSPSGSRVFFRTVDRGQDHLTWDMRDDHGTPIPSGAYFLRMTCDQGAVTRRILRIH
jgi:hypothetical protein